LDDRRREPASGAEAAQERPAVESLGWGPLTLPIYSPDPDYPLAARRRGLEGAVVLRVTVGSSGRPIEVAVLESSGHDVLDRAAIDSVRRWQFGGAANGSLLAEFKTDIPIRFRLTKSPP
jgi:TonB family protein